MRKGKRTENNTEKPKSPYHIWNTTGINTFKYRLFILNQRCSVLFLIQATTIKKIYTDARCKNNIKIYSFLSEIFSEKRGNCGKNVFFQIILYLELYIIALLNEKKSRSRSFCPQNFNLYLNSTLPQSKILKVHIQVIYRNGFHTLHY